MVGHAGAEEGVVDREAYLLGVQQRANDTWTVWVVRPYLCLYSYDDLSSGIEKWQIEVEGSAYRS